MVLAVWALLALLALSCEALSLVTGGREVAGVGELLRSLSNGRARLIAQSVGWMWLGWHFFAR
jgi:hypothetical protein